MPVSLQSLHASPWKLHDASELGLGAPPILLAKSAFSKSLARRGRSVVRCRAEEGDVSVTNNAGVKGPSHGSWLQIESLVDRYAGWSSDEKQTNGDNVAGWLKVGGTIFLAIGFALGARSVYTRKGSINELAIPAPAKEQIISSNSADSQADHESMDNGTMGIEAETDNQEGTQKHERELTLENDVSDLQQKVFATTQVALPSKEVDDLSKKDVDANLCTADDPTTIESPSALASEIKEDLDGGPTDELTPNSSEQESLASDSIEFPVEPSEVAENLVNEVNIGHMLAQTSSEGEASPPGLSPTVIPSEGGASPPGLSPTVVPSVVTPEVSSGNDFEQYYISHLEKVTFEDEISNELPRQHDVSDSSLVDALDENKIPSEMKDNSLHDLPPLSAALDGASETVQKRQSQVHGSSDSVKEIAAEMSVVGQTEFHRSSIDAKTHTHLFRHLTSVVVPAPTTPTAALQGTLGRVVVPATVDHMQEQALAALQALKVIEAGVEPGAICTRREYARWLIAASGTLTRSPAHKVFPAMYIENVSELAFDDVSPEDPDFPCIQGLAEAGLISSKFTKQDKLESSGSHVSPDECNEKFFSPDSPLSRQDLISWKLALERQFTLTVNKEVLQSKSGFIDIDRIHQDAWPALLADLSAGERSIMSLAFGYTRMFQPDKPVTKAQAAIALSTGEAADLVSEELARLEAESIAEAAVAAELALESKAQLEVVATFNRLLEEEKAKKAAADKLAESTLAELQKLKAEMDEEKYSLLREHAAVESEREFLSKLRQEVEEKSEPLANAKLEVAFEREKIEKLCVEAEAERATLASLRTELEVEKKALTMARLWAEEEARKAYSHAKVLEAARKRWEDQGVQVQVKKELDESNIPAINWRHSEDFQGQSPSMTGLLTKSRNFRWEFIEVVARILRTIRTAVGQFRQKSIESFQEVGRKAVEVKDTTTSAVTKTAEIMQRRIYSSTSSVSSGVREGTRRIVEECKGGAEKLAQKFKTT